MSGASRTDSFYRKRVLKDHKTTSGEFLNFSYGANSITGWRAGQEDRYVCLPVPDFTRTWSFFGIYDGHGGDEVAEYLKRKLHHHILEKLEEFGDIKIAFSEGFKACDQSIKELSKDEYEEIRNVNKKVFNISDTESTSVSEDGESDSEAYMTEVKNEVYKQLIRMQTDLSRFSDTTDTNEESEENGAKGKKDEDEDFPLVGFCCGSTATVVVFTDQIIYSANVGDSRSIASVNGKVKTLTHDHRPLNRKECERILAAGHRISRGRVDGGLNMSRAFGDYALKMKDVRPNLQAVIVEPTITAIEINPELDFIVIASDGIWNTMKNQAVIDFIFEYSDLPLPEICAKMFEHILIKSDSKSGQDNMSMIIIRNELSANKKVKVESKETKIKQPKVKKIEPKKQETKKTEPKRQEVKKIKRLRK